MLKPIVDSALNYIFDHTNVDLTINYDKKNFSFNEFVLGDLVLELKGYNYYFDKVIVLILDIPGLKRDQVILQGLWMNRINVAITFYNVNPQKYFFLL